MTIAGKTYTPFRRTDLSEPHLYLGTVGFFDFPDKPMCEAASWPPSVKRKEKKRDSIGWIRADERYEAPCAECARRAEAGLEPIPMPMTKCA